jgi:hypothetical protein
MLVFLPCKLNLFYLLQLSTYSEKTIPNLYAIDICGDYH